MQALQEQQFDDQFSDAWNGTPGSKIKAQRNEHIADLKNKADQARAKRDELDGLFDDATNDMRDANLRLRLSPSARPQPTLAGSTRIQAAPLH